MSIRMNLYASRNQATTTLQNCQQQIAAYQAVQRAAEKFVADTENLKGAAYTAARRYYSSVLLPLAQGAETYVEAVKRAMKKLPEEYQAKCFKDLDEEELKQQIREQEAFIANLQLQHHELSRSSMPTEAKTDSLSAMLKLIRGHQANKRALEDLLQRLLEFNAYSPQIFAEADSLLADLQVGLHQSQNSWDSAKKTFIISKDLQWAKNLTTKHATMVEERSFVQNLQVQYGFDPETANNILDLKRGIDKKFPKISQAERDYILLRIIGMANYDGMKWNATAGGLGEYFHSSYPVDGTIRTFGLPEIIKKLGLDEEKIPAFLYNLRLQHELSGVKFNENLAENLKDDRPNDYIVYKQNAENIYGTMTDAQFDKFWNERLSAVNNKNDFTHQSVTMATHLYSNQFRLANLLGGHNHTNELAGWRGDATYGAFVKPKIGNDDYKADLDSVNLIHRMAKGQSYLEASHLYYKGLETGATNRASEFKKNVGGIDYIKKAVYDSIPKRIEHSEKGNADITKTRSESEKTAFMKQELPEVAAFLKSLEENSNDLKLD